MFNQLLLKHFLTVFMARFHSSSLSICCVVTSAETITCIICCPHNYEIELIVNNEIYSPCNGAWKQSLQPRMPVWLEEAQ